MHASITFVLSLSLGKDSNSYQPGARQLLSGQGIYITAVTEQACSDNILSTSRQQEANPHQKRTSTNKRHPTPQPAYSNSNPRCTCRQDSTLVEFELSSLTPTSLFISLAVVIPKFGSSMHDAKARMHRSELGSLLAVGPEEGYSTQKH